MWVRKWLKRVVVEGYTDAKGDYLYNLNLSLQRSQRVICLLMEAPPGDETALSTSQREHVRDLFLVGGYSFNSIKPSDEESRRIELRLEYWINENEKKDAEEERRRISQALPQHDFGTCRIGRP